jgi:DNA repair exonuclease SbcCD nuclease subunit
MKFLFIGDVHIKTDNSEEIDILMLEIERICRLTKYDYIIVGGDVMHYHERLFTQCLNKSLFFLNKLSNIAYTFVLVGNHDYINNSEFLTENHWMNSMKNVKNIKIVDQVIEENDFILCPYVYPGRFIEALETKTKNWMSKKIIFAHQEFKGCKMGAIDSIEGDDWKGEFPIVVSGHIHDNQKIGKNVYYPGSPLQHSFGDSETRVLCDISIENDEKEVIITDIPLNVPKKKIMRIEKNDFKDIKKIMTKISQDDADKVKLKLDITTDEFNLFKKSKEYSELMNKGIKVQLMKKKNENKDDKIEKNENKDMNFNVILENMIKKDEEMVKDLYHEVVLGMIRL